MPFTRGFQTIIDRDEHYKKHGHEFGATSPEDYEDRADTFLGGPLLDHTRECTRSNGSKIRYNFMTHHFGVVGRDGCIWTYYIVDTRRTRTPTAAAYFQSECNK